MGQRRKGKQSANAAKTSTDPELDKIQKQIEEKIKKEISIIYICADYICAYELESQYGFSIVASQLSGCVGSTRNDIGIFREHT